MRLLPRSLYGRLVVVLLGGLIVAQAASFYLNFAERGALLHRAGAMRQEQQIADISRLLDSLSPQERSRVVSVFNAPPLAVSLDRPPLAPRPGQDRSDVSLSMLSTMLQYSLGESLHVEVMRRAGDSQELQPGRQGSGMPMMQGFSGMMAMHDGGPQTGSFVVQVTLRDGTRVTFDSYLTPEEASVPGRLALTLVVLLVSVLVLSLVAVRWVTRPLSTLATAAEALGADIDRPPLPETGPVEAQKAARAFKGMQKRLSHSIAERTRMLAAMSHDLKTPITRLKLRVEMLEDEDLKAKIDKDLAEMDSMVAQTLEFMRDGTAQEPLQRLNLMALLESLQTDYEETGARVDLNGRVDPPFHGRPLALRRCLTNLLDNAIRYGGCGIIVAEQTPERVILHIMDEGPGMAPEDFERAFEPFFRGEASRNRETGGTGLGLGIARNIARAHGGDLVLQNRASGGLEAILTLPRGPGAKVEPRTDLR